VTNFRLEAKKKKRGKRLTGNIQIRTVNIISWWHELTLSKGFPRPGSVCPRKEHQPELFDHIRIRDVEVMFDNARRDEGAKLSK